MSVVTDIILVTFLNDGAKRDNEHPNADRLSAYLEREHDRDLQKVDEHAGGDKMMQCDVFMAAINHLDKDEFVKLFRSIEWEWPEKTQLMIKGEWDDRFEIFTLKSNS